MRQREAVHGMNVGSTGDGRREARSHVKIRDRERTPQGTAYREAVSGQPVRSHLDFSRVERETGAERLERRFLARPRAEEGGAAMRLVRKIEHLRLRGCEHAIRQPGNVDVRANALHVHADGALGGESD